ncbi:hypothetical protein JCM33374_g3322 [Metschnikowia sp. JCM 33374]|nr:hypothetical protein JCM33374_g3322 [Metschnikowia sp. JCM 33374]
MKISSLVISTTAVLSITEAAAINTKIIVADMVPEPENTPHKRGLLKNLFCIRGNLDESDAYGDNTGCTESSNSFILEFEPDSNSSEVTEDETYKAISEKLKALMGDLRIVEKDLEDGEDFRERSPQAQSTKLCQAVNVWNSCKIRADSIGYSEWIHFFSKAEEYNVDQLDKFQTNIYDRFEHVKDLIEHYSRTYNIHGLVVG